jgi:hypothetical protein
VDHSRVCILYSFLFYHGLVLCHPWAVRRAKMFNTWHDIRHNMQDDKLIWELYILNWQSKPKRQLQHDRYTTSAVSHVAHLCCRPCLAHPLHFSSLSTILAFTAYQVYACYLFLIGAQRRFCFTEVASEVEVIKTGFVSGRKTAITLFKYAVLAQ